jgi:hypothetical protein
VVPPAFNVEPQGSGHDQENNLAIGERNVKYLDVTPDDVIFIRDLIRRGEREGRKIEAVREKVQFKIEKKNHAR